MKNILPLLIFIITTSSAIAQKIYIRNDSIAFTQDSLVLEVGTHRGNVFWQQSFDKTKWITFSNQKGDVLIANKKVDAYYRAKIVEGSCNPIYSDTIRVSTNDSIKSIYASTSIVGAYTEVKGEIVKFKVKNDTLVCEKINNEYLFQGDIVLTDEQVILLSEKKGASISELVKQWPYNIVYYSISKDFVREQRITEAIKHWTEKTNLKFVERDGQDNYIEFINDPDVCSSNVGMTGSQQYIKFTDWGSTGNAIHEIGHAIGLLHEQSRSDRDNYIIIHFDNILKDKQHNFDLVANSINTHYFDFNSIMLYPCYNSFAIDPSKPVITKKDNSLYNAQRSYLSLGDLDIVDDLYPPIEQTVTDIDGNIYKTVKIGDQWWMAENLKTTKYNDGTSIPNVTDNTEWANLTSPGYCWYDSDISYKTPYGALYNWYAVNTGKLAPAGWHVPTDAEWTTLTTFLGGESVAGGKLKEAGTIHWSSPNTGATNESGFTALPAGNHDGNGTFYNIDHAGYWWSSPEGLPNNTWYRHMTNQFSSVFRYNLTPKNAGLSVLCVMGDITANIVVPTLNTSIASNITQTTASSGGNVTSDGGGTITARGVCWSTSENPTTANSKTTNSTGSGSFTSSITGLTANTPYYVRAYATNGAGTGYGNNVGFTTSSIGDLTGTFTDSRDGKTYKWVQIGSQTWMAENLAYLPSVNLSSTESTESSNYYVYDYEGVNVISAKASSNYATYGALYNWPAAMTACPLGWHLPSDDEWKQLEMTLEMSQTQTNLEGMRGTNQGNQIKNTSGWYINNGTNISGFSGLPGGYRDYNVGFNGISGASQWWSSTEGTNGAWGRSLSFQSDLIGRYDYSKKIGFSVRCIKD